MSKCADPGFKSHSWFESLSTHRLATLQEVTMKFLVSFQQKHISVFQLSKFSTPTQKSFPSFPVKDSQAAISVVVSIVVGVHGEAQLPIALEQVIALSDSNTNSFCEHLCESENLTNERPSQISIKHNQIRILLVQTKTGQKHQT